MTLTKTDSLPNRQTALRVPLRTAKDRDAAAGRSSDNPRGCDISKGICTLHTRLAQDTARETRGAGLWTSTLR